MASLNGGQSWLCRQLGEKAAQLRRRFELRNRIEPLEGAGESVGDPTLNYEDFSGTLRH